MDNTFNIRYAPKKWAENLEFQLALSKQKLHERELRTFSRVNPAGQEKRQAYTALEQLESASGDIHQGCDHKVVHTTGV